MTQVQSLPKQTCLLHFFGYFSINCMIPVYIIITASIIIPFSLFPKSLMSKSNPPLPSTTFLQLSHRLSDIWQDSHVASEYRLMVMQYIKGLAHGDQEKYLKFQVELNMGQKSHYFEIFRINMRRKIALFKLRALIKMNNPSLMSKISQICQLMASIRDMNVQISEKIIDMVKFYNLVLKEADETILVYVWTLINNLNQQNEFIIKSQLSNHITFSKNYDPYFIYYYERQKEFSIDGPQPRYLNRLYSLNINEIYKTINVKIEMVALKEKIQKRLSQLGCNYRKEQHGTYMYRVKQQERTSPFTNRSAHKQQGFYKFQKPLKPAHHSRTKSHDFIFKEQSKLNSSRRASSNQVNIKSQGKSKLGKIHKNGSMGITSSEISGSLILSRNIHQNRLYNDSRSQSRSERQHKRKLKLVHLQPLSIRLEGPQKCYQEQATYRQEEPRRPVKLQGRMEVMRRQQDKETNPNPIKYDYNPQNTYKRYPGFIKDIRQRIKPRDSQAGLAEERPIKSRNVIQEPQIKDQSMQFPEEQPKTVEKIDLSVIQPSRKPQQLQKKDQQKKVKQKSKIKMVSQIVQTQPQENYQLLQSHPPRVDFQCQTDPYFQPSFIQERQISLAPSEKQECNNPLQHLQAVQFMQKLNRNDDNTSLATLDEQYFIDQRLTPMKAYRIPMVRDITQEEMKAVDRQRESIAKLSKKQNKLVTFQAKAQEQKQIKRQLRIKIGKYTLSEALGALQTYQINPKYKQTFNVDNKLKEHIRSNQAYILQYIINDQTAALALASPLPNSTLLLKLWGPTVNFDATTSENLFLKYLEYLCKSKAKKVMYKGVVFSELTKGDFINKKDDIYERAVENKTKQKPDFREFFSVQCSNISAKSISTKLQWQQAVENFKGNKFYCAEFITEANVSNLPSKVSDLFIQQSQINSFKAVNQILSQYNFQGQYMFSSQNDSQNLNLLMLDFQSSFKACFISQDFHLIIKVLLIFQTNQVLIVGLPLVKGNSIVYFGKGTTLSQMIETVKAAKRGQQTISCKIPMFNKTLAGQLQANHFGYWDFSLFWEDPLQSASIKHTNHENLRNFCQSSFNAVLSIQGHCVYGVSITPQDFLE